MSTELFQFNAAPGKAARAKGRLFRAALVLFGEKGPDGATVRDIARAAGQNVAAIAYHFGSKQKLYRAVIESIVAGIRGELRDVLVEVEALRKSGQSRPKEARRLLTAILTAVYLRLLSRDEAVPVIQMVVREQLGPTPAFDILYEHGFRQIHEALCFLVGMATGTDETGQETILRTHLLMGQVYFFAMSREAVLRRLNWKTLEGDNAALVTELLGEHLDVLLSGPARKHPNQRHT